MKINIEELYKQYEEIQKQCIKDDYPIPFLINATLIPKEHKLSYYNIKQLRKKNPSNRLYFDKRKQELEKINHKVNLETYWGEELQNFIKQYPQFKKIIMVEKKIYNIILKSIEDEITKTHDGTSMGVIGSFLDDWSKEHIRDYTRTFAIMDENGNIVRSMDDIKGVNPTLFSYNTEVHQAYKENDAKDLHLICSGVNNIERIEIPEAGGDMFIPEEANGPLWLLRGDEMGDYRNLRSVTMVSPNGTRTTFIRNDKFSPENHEAYSKTLKDMREATMEYRKDYINTYEQKVQEMINNTNLPIKVNGIEIYSPDTLLGIYLNKAKRETTKELGTWEQTVLKGQGFDKQLEECNIKARVSRKNTDSLGSPRDWGSNPKSWDDSRMEDEIRNQDNFVNRSANEEAFGAAGGKYDWTPAGLEPAYPEGSGTSQRWKMPSK